MYKLLTCILLCLAFETKVSNSEGCEGCSHFCTVSIDGSGEWCSCYENSACPIDKMDVFFILDAADDITDDNFKYQTEFINTFAKMYNISEEGVQISAMIHNEESTKVLNFRQSINLQRVERLTKKEKVSGKGNDLAVAILDAIRYRLKPVQGRRQEVPLVVIIISSTPSNSTSKNERRAIKRIYKNTENVFTIGVGKNAPQDLLQKIAKNDDTKYKSLNSFSQLNHKLIAQFGFCPEIKHSLKLTEDLKTCDADECYADISGCSDGCNNTIGSYQCTCPPEKFLSSDGHNCVSDPCDDNLCDQFCENTNANYTCSCGEGYSLDVDGLTCNDVDECAVYNGGCQEDCLNTVGSYHCECEHGFLRGSGRKKCVISCYTCDNVENIDECNKLKICQNNQASCYTTMRTNNNRTTFSKGCQQSLACINNFIQNTNMGAGGERQCNGKGINSKCDCCCFTSACNSDQCKFYENIPMCDAIEGDHIMMIGDINGRVSAGGLAGVRCEPGYKEVGKIGTASYITCDYDPLKNTSQWNMDPSKLDTCEDINECKYEGRYCVAPAICVNTPGDFHCECPPNNNSTDVYEILQNYYCDLNECLSGVEGTGLCSHGCVNLLGTFTCSCPDGMILSNDNVTCRVSLCAEDNGGCEQVCTDNGNVTCSCSKSYELNDDKTSCNRIYSPCDFNNGGCSHTCDYSDGVVYCSCPDSMELENDETLLCVQIQVNYTLQDECASNNGGCSHFCIDHPAGYECACPVGYQLEDVENSHYCIENNPCEPNPCRNGQCFRTFNSSYFCHCQENMYLAEDGLTCKSRSAEADCPQGYFAAGHSCMKQLFGDYTYYYAGQACHFAWSRLAKINDYGTLRAVRDVFREPYWIGSQINHNTGLWTSSDRKSQNFTEEMADLSNEGNCAYVEEKIFSGICHEKRNVICEKPRRQPFVLFPNMWPSGATGKLYMQTDKNQIILIFPVPVLRVNAWHCSAKMVADNEYIFTQDDVQRGGGKGKCEFVVEMFQMFPAEQIVFKKL